MSAEKPVKSAADRKLDRAVSTGQIVAHSFEFVALPGRAEGIQSEIPVAAGHAFGSTEGFVGCLVLVSEQEARLVTVITMWTSHRFELCSNSGERLHKWLSPYVDRWLRTRKYASFVTAPLLASSGFPEDVNATTTHLQ